MSAMVKIFRCGPGCEVSAWCSFGPRWKISQGGSREDLGAFYGDCELAVDATLISADRLVLLRMAAPVSFQRWGSCVGTPGFARHF